MLEMIEAKDKLSIVALARSISREYSSKDIADLSKKLVVPLMSEWRNRQTVIERLAAPCTPICDSPDQEQHILAAQRLITQLMEKSSAVQVNSERNTYAPWFKQFITKMLDEGASYKTISSLTGISEENLPKFRKDISLSLIKGSISEEHKYIEKVWDSASHKQRKTLDHFWTYLGRNYPESKLSRNEVRTILIDLGLRYPRSKKSKNHGAQVKTAFCPNAIWEGDGKELIIRINGIRHSFCWYAFVDQDTTLIVGSNIGRVESSEVFLRALKNAGSNRGVFAWGVLMDNRLGENDLSPVQDFCREHSISIIRTFPGNSKSNGMIENNFSIFEKFVGEINITGKNQAELAVSIARIIIEIFTQQRNHAPRRRFGDYSPMDRSTTDRPPEYVRSAVEKLASRLAIEAACAEIKWQAIRPSRDYFGNLTDQSIEKIMRLLVKYPLHDVISAQGKYLAKIKKHPTNTFSVEYFMAILRNTREEQAKQVFNEAYRAGLEAIKEYESENYLPFDRLTEEILDVIIEITEMKSPSRRMVEIEALAWWMTQYSVTHSLPELWTSVSDAAAKSILLSLKSWSEICEYLMRHIGQLLINENPSRHDRSSQREKSVKIAPSSTPRQHL
jgi:transposase InsO family protein